MMLTCDEKQELELLRRSAALFIKSPLEKAFFELESIVNNQHSKRVDAVMPVSAFYVLARALIALKNEVIK